MGPRARRRSGTGSGVGAALGAERAVQPSRHSSVKPYNSIRCRATRPAARWPTDRPRQTAHRPRQPLRATRRLGAAAAANRPRHVREHGYRGGAAAAGDSAPLRKRGREPSFALTPPEQRRAADAPMALSPRETPGLPRASPCRPLGTGHARSGSAAALARRRKPGLLDTPTAGPSAGPSEPPGGASGRRGRAWRFSGAPRPRGGESYRKAPGRGLARHTRADAARTFTLPTPIRPCSTTAAPTPTPTSSR